MQYVDYTRYNKAVKDTAKKLGINEKVVDKVYRGYCKLLIENLSALDLKNDLTEEQFKKLQTSINIPSIGKIYCCWDNYQNRKNYYVQKSQKDKTS